MCPRATQLGRGPARIRVPADLYHTSHVQPYREFPLSRVSRNLSSTAGSYHGASGFFFFEQMHLDSSQIQMIYLVPTVFTVQWQALTFHL